VTKSEAHDLLRQHDGWGGIEAWIAGRRWKVAPKGWTVEAELQGWRFQVEPVPDVSGDICQQAGKDISDPSTCMPSEADKAKQQRLLEKE